MSRRRGKCPCVSIAANKNKDRDSGAGYSKRAWKSCSLKKQVEEEDVKVKKKRGGTVRVFIQLVSRLPGRGRRRAEASTSTPMQQSLYNDNA